MNKKKSPEKIAKKKIAKKMSIAECFNNESHYLTLYIRAILPSIQSEKFNRISIDNDILVLKEAIQLLEKWKIAKRKEAVK